MKVYSFFYLLGALLLAGPVQHVYAQQTIGYVDSEYILSETPEYATVQQQLDRMAEEWRQELDERRAEVDEMFREYQARELLYTNEERQRMREDIMRAEEEVEQLRVRYFGPDGELFQEQERMMRPIQERILAAVEEVAEREGYDYVFDKGGDFLFMFVQEEYDLSDAVLQELGIDVENNGN
ncbi:MAG: OmpH family outer membrane protein [Rhodothermales bacterium]